MNINLAEIGSLVSLLTGALVTIGTFMLQRQRRQAIDADDMEDELEIRTEQWQAALRYIRFLEDDRAAHTDLPPLSRPPELRAGYFQQRVRGGRHRRSGQYDEPGGDGLPAGRDGAES